MARTIRGVYCVFTVFTFKLYTSVLPLVKCCIRGYELVILLNRRWIGLYYYCSCYYY